jgi:hypothetical protein
VWQSSPTGELENFKETDNLKIQVLEGRKIFKKYSTHNRKLHNEELHNLYSSLSIMRMIKSRRMRWAGHVARIGEKRNA